MKKIIIHLVLLLVVPVSATLGQADRSVYPEPGPAPEIRLGEYERFELPNGLKVFIVENHKLPKVTFYLALDRDPVAEGEKAGLLDMVGEMMTSGTENRSKEELDEEIDYIGASLNASSATINASCLKKHQEKLLELMTDVLYHPAFPGEELEKIRKRAVSGLAANKRDPDYIAGVVSDALQYGKNHPYGEVETEKTIGNVTVEDVREYYRSYFKPNIAYLAIVGDIDPAEARSLADKYFGEWEKGEVPEATYRIPEPPAETQVALVDRPSGVQSVLKVVYPLDLPYASPDYISTRVLNHILGGGSSSRLFMNLREDKGYTYGAYSSLDADEVVGSFSAGASVRTEVTDSAVHELLYEMEHILEKTVTQEELEDAVNNLSGSFARSLEDPATIARFAINTERYGLPDDFYPDYLKNLSEVTVGRLNEIAPKYIKPGNAWLVVVGNTAEFGDKMKRFGKVGYYTDTGDPEEEIEMEDTSMTAEKVLENYIRVIGGKEKLKSVRTMKMVSESEMQGQKITMEMLVDKENRRALQLVKMGGQELSHILITSDKAVVTAQGQERTMTDEQFARYKPVLYIFPELYYNELGYTAELDGVKNVEGEKAYKLVITGEDGTKTTDYYSVDSGLKLKTENPVTGDIVFKEYAEQNGIKYSSGFTISNPNMPVPMPTEVKEFSLNVDVQIE